MSSASSRPGSFELSRQFSWVLRLPLLGYGTMLPFALLGIAMSAPSWRRLFPLYAMIAVYLATALIFYVLSRYRMPAEPVLIVFAAHRRRQGARLHIPPR